MRDGYHLVINLCITHLLTGSQSFQTTGFGILIMVLRKEESQIFVEHEMI